MAAASPLLILLLFLLVPLPFSSVAARSSPNLGKFFKQVVSPIARKIQAGYLKDAAQQGVQNFPVRGNTQDPHQLGSSAASSFGTFTFNLSIGTSPQAQTLPVFMDITSELIWVQCDIMPTAPETPTFLSNYSDTFAEVGCNTDTCQRNIPREQCSDSTCTYTEVFYGSGSGNTSGYLANDTFSFDTMTAPNVVFGCSTQVLLPDLADAGASGFLGFNRGPLSLVSQLQISQFSYFVALPDISGNVESFLSWSWGDATAAAPAAAAPAQRSCSTPLLTPTVNQVPYLYYVKLTGVEVDGQLVTTTGTFDVRADGSGGLFLSTTLPVTYLQEVAYNVIRMELVNRIQSQGVSPVDDPGLDHLCFLTQSFASVKVPNLALVFDGDDDAVMELTVENYFFNLPDGQTCLSILPSTGGSVLGSLLQAGRTMTYDIYSDGSGLLTFETLAEGAPTAAGTPTAAGASAQAQVPLVIIMATLLAVWGLGLQNIL